MLVNINAASAGRQSALGELGELSRARVTLSEFKYNRGAEIYGEAEPADYIYQVVQGAVRSYKLLSDGRRQIGAFHLVGDIFGLENSAAHRFTAEAIVETTVRLMKRRSLEHVAESDVFVALDLLNMTTNNLQHAEDHMLLLGAQDVAGTRGGFPARDGSPSDGGRRHGSSDVSPGYRGLSGPDTRNRIARAFIPSWQRDPWFPGTNPAPDRAVGPSPIGRVGTLNARATIRTRDVGSA